MRFKLKTKVFFFISKRLRLLELVVMLKNAVISQNFETGLIKHPVIINLHNLYISIFPVSSVLLFKYCQSTLVLGNYVKCFIISLDVAVRLPISQLPTNS